VQVGGKVELFLTIKDIKWEENGLFWTAVNLVEQIYLNKKQKFLWFK